MSKTFAEYQEQARRLLFVANKTTPTYVYAALGLAGETGEIMEQLKKSIRETDGSYISDSRKANLKLELGDCLWYLSTLADCLGFSLETIAEANIRKLTERQAKKLEKVIE